MKRDEQTAEMIAAAHADAAKWRRVKGVMDKPSFTDDELREALVAGIDGGVLRGAHGDRYDSGRALAPDAPEPDLPDPDPITTLQGEEHEAYHAFSQAAMELEAHQREFANKQARYKHTLERLSAIAARKKGAAP